MFLTVIATATTEAAVMPAKSVIATDATIIVTRKAKEITITVAGKEEIATMMTIMASHFMWRKTVVALAPALRAA
eukprot:14976741-Ditylum_brightwellii.AAC.1